MTEDLDARVLVIGLDGATLDLIRPWAAEGRLTELGRLMQEGAWCELKSQLPPSSVPNWPSFATGKNPGKHGVLWWTQARGDASAPSIVDRRSIKGPTLWEIAGRQGKRVAVINVPVTYPPEKVNGVMVTGLLTPPSADDVTYPADLKAELDSHVGGYRVTHSVVHRRGAEEEFLQDVLDVLHRRLRASLHVMRTYDWDLFIVVLNATDTVIHKFWKDMDSQHPLHVAEDGKRLGDAILRVYQAVDEAVASLTEEAGSQTHTIVMSDHGAGGFYEAFFPNNWLMDQGLLSVRRQASSQLRYWLFRLGLTVNKIYPVANAFIGRLGDRRLRSRLGVQGKGGGILGKLFLSEQDIDWSRTKAHASGAFGQIRINLKGRDPEGTVLPGHEYEALRDDIIARLEGVIVPSTGLPYLGGGYRKEELFHGSELQGLPDIICVPRDGRYVDMGLGFVSNRWFDKVSIVSGTHRQKGTLIIHGPDISPGLQMEEADIVDLAPTILHLLGLPVPDDMDGRVLVEAFLDERVRTCPVATVPAEDNESQEPIGEATKRDVAEIEDRLRGLGYLP